MRHLRSAVARLIPVLSLAAVVVPGALGQVVRARLVEANGTAAIAGAMIALVDPDGADVDRTLTGEDGGARLTAPGPGRYRLRADRVGYAASRSDFFVLAVGDSLSVNVTASVEAIGLRGLQVGGERRCGERPRGSLALARVWEEARKALAAAKWTEDKGLYEYQISQVRERLDPDSRQVLTQKRTLSRVRTQRPYVARAADSLVEAGFARLEADGGAQYWAPDADVLLSDAFVRTHCFSLATPEEARPDLVGLAFEPVPDREVPEIAGGMWLDTSTAELRQVDFEYVNVDLPGSPPPEGTLEFAALPNGAWIVKSWRIRMPAWGSSVDDRTRLPVHVLAAIEVAGADVIAVRGEEDTVLARKEASPVGGVVLDSLGAGLAGARVFAKGTSVEAVTDQEGEFTLSGLEPGLYSVGFSHPYLEELAYAPDPFAVKVAADREAPWHVTFSAPSRSSIVGRMCSEAERPHAPVRAGRRVPMTGVLVGRVTTPTGTGVPSATVRVVSRHLELHSSEGGLRVRGSKRTMVATTDSAGYYRACWIPVDTSLRVAVVETPEGDENIDWTESEPLTRERTVVVEPDRTIKRFDFRLPGVR